MAEPLRDVEAIFFAALKKSIPQERNAFVEGACAGDSKMLRRIQELLENHDESAGPLDAPPPGVEPTIDQPITERPGTMIGPYRLMEQIGEGGMGVVYVAEQRKPVRRKVALKIIKPGMDTKEVVARFEAERQALALMDHPNIARVLDAGATESERPYFVMELVRGIPITEYCDQNKLTTRERLELFTTVCQAITHAHQKGVIHRDVKPTNVMVTLHDGTPVPKIIDFGVAKAINQQLTERTVYTRYSQMVGTPMYMSPEQAELSGLDVDTRTDIYSLGVLLYELLTGTTPFDRERLREAAYDEIRRIIREEEPPRPSTRVSTLGETATAISAHRSSDPKRLGQVLRGDVDWIVMQALEKDRTRRYATAAEMAADVTRHLNHEPIIAGRPSAIYRLQKFARRNRAAMVTAGLVGGALVVGLALTTWQAVRATQAEKRRAQAHATAVADRDLAIAAQVAAKEQRDRAMAAEKVAREQRVRAENVLYESDIMRAFNAWEQGQSSQMADLIERYRPGPNEPDLRGFEWYFLWRRRAMHLAAPKLSHSSVVLAMDYSPDGQSLATADINGNVTVWDLATLKPRFRQKGDAVGSAFDIAFSPDGQSMVSVGRLRIGGGLEWVVRLWDIAKKTVGPPILLNGATDADFSPDGDLLAVACTEGIALLDSATGEARETLDVSGSEAVQVALAPNGQLLVSRHANGGIRLWDMSRGDPTSLAGENHHALDVTFSPDGKTLATGDLDGSIRLWDVATATQRTQLRDSQHPIRRIAISPDGNTLAAASDKWRLWDLRTEKPLGYVPGGNGPLSFSPDGKSLACATSDNAVQLRPARADEDGSVLTSDTGNVWSVAVSSNGTTLASGAITGGVVLWDTFTGRMRNTIQQPRSKLTSVAFIPDSTNLVVQEVGGSVSLYDTLSGRLLRRLNSPMQWQLTRSMVVSPDGSTLVSGDDSGRILVRNVATGVIREPYPKQSGKVVGLAYSHDGRLLASTVERDQITLWDSATGDLIHAFGTQVEPAGPLAFSPDNRLLVCGCFDGTIRMWDVASRQPLTPLSRHDSQATALAFSPDGKTLVSGDNDGTIKIWDVGTGRQRANLNSGHGRVTSLAMLPDGATLVSGGTKLPLRLWRATTDADLEQLPDRLRLEDRVRSIWEAEPLERLQEVDQFVVEWKPDGGTELQDFEVAAAISVGNALLKGVDPDDSGALFKLANAIDQSERPDLRELARLWRKTLQHRRAERQVADGRLDDAIATYSGIIELGADGPALWAQRGALHARKRNWPEAAKDLVMAAQKDQHNRQRWFWAVPLLILADDQEGHQQLCQVMLRQFGKKDHLFACMTVEAAVFAPQTMDLSQLPVATIERALEDGSAPIGWSGYAQCALALVAYRAGEPQKAMDRIRQSQQSKSHAMNATLRARVLSVEAMVLHRLGKHDEAMQTLGEANELIGSQLAKLQSGRLRGSYIEWLIAEVLRREATALIGKPDDE